MQRTDLETWFATHPDAIRMNSRALLDECEFEVRHHAHHDAWIHARDVAQKSLRRFERVFGLPASDSFVTREVCHEIARELKRSEPHVGEMREEDWVSDGVLGMLDPRGRAMLNDWLIELAEQEEHAAWVEIVHFTDRLARKLIDDAHMTLDLEWSMEQSYPRVAARVARMLIREFETHASEEELEVARWVQGH